MGKFSFNQKTQSFVVEMKKLSSAGSKTINLTAKNNQRQEIFTKDILLNVAAPDADVASVVASNPLKCTVGLQGDNLNVFLIGDNIVKHKDQLKVYMFTNRDDYAGTSIIIETPDLLKYSNLDGQDSPNPLTYKVVAGYDINKQQAEEKAKAIPDNSQNCKTIAIGNPCVVCFQGNNQS